MPRRKGSPEAIDPANAPAGTPAFLCARDSGGQRQGKSVPDQLAVMRGIVREHGWVIVDEFADVARKGGDSARGEFNRLLERLQERPVAAKILLYWDEKRLARDRGQGYLLQAYCIIAGVAFYSASAPVQAEAQKWMLPMMFTMGEEESIQQGRDVARGLGSMIDAGYAPGGQPPIGYRCEYVEIPTGREIRRWPRWVQDESRQEMVALAWKMNLEGSSFRQIKEATNLRPNHARLVEIFGNPAYCGFPTWWLHRNELDVTDCAELAPIIPPYVSVAEWLRCRRSETTINERRREAAGYPLSGLGRCVCGLPLEVHSSTTGYQYRCPSLHRQGKKCGQSKPTGGPTLEREILQALAPHFTAERIREALQDLNRALEAEYQAANVERLELGKRLEGIRQEMTNLTAAIAKTGPGEAILQALQEKEAEQARIKAEIVMLPKQVEPLAIDPAEADGWARMFQEDLLGLNRAERRQLFQGVGLTYKLHVDHVECSIEWPPLKLLLGVFYGSPRGIRTPDLSLERAAS